MKRLYALPLLLTFFFLAPLSQAATGFIDSPLLISPEAPRDGDQVTLSVLFHNSEDTAITGTVLFYDGEALLSRKSIHIDSGDVGIAATTFTIESGIHKFSATMSEIDRSGTSGEPETIVLPVTTVTLPAKVITKKLALNAQANGGSSGSESVILQKVEAAQTAVLDAIPEGAKETVSAVASGMDDWRSGVGEKLISNRDEVKSYIVAGDTIDAANAELKPGKKPAIKSEKSDNGTPNKIKYYFYSMLGYFFDKPFVFYLGSIVILYFVIRFIFRRIRAYRENH